MTSNQLIVTRGNRPESLWANQTVTARCDALQRDPEISDNFLFTKVEIYSDGAIMGIQGNIEDDTVERSYVPKLGLGEEGSNVEPDVIRQLKYDHKHMVNTQPSEKLVSKYYILNFIVQFQLYFLALPHSTHTSQAGN